MSASEGPLKSGSYNVGQRNERIDVDTTCEIGIRLLRTVLDKSKIYRDWQPMLGICVMLGERGSLYQI